MNKNLLIFFIILSSFLSGVGGAFVFQHLGNSKNTEKEEKIVSSIEVKELESTVTQSVKNISPSVVSIIIKKDLGVFRGDPWGFFRQQVGTISRKVGGGTGFFITRDGKIITNKHVVSDPSAEYIVVTSDGKEHEVKILALDPLSDLAIVQISKNKEIIPLNFIDESSRIELGEFVIAIGNALGEFQNSVSLGIVSGKNRRIEAPGENLNNLIQTDAAINPGNSGGPLIDLENNVIGINTAISAEAQGIGFAIPLTKKRIDYMLQSIKTYGEIKAPLVGINYIMLTPQIAKELGISIEEGAYVKQEKGSILPGSSAEKAGIRSGDIIIEIDGQKINSQILLGELLQNKIPGEIIRLKVLRKGGKIETIELPLGTG